MPIFVWSLIFIISLAVLVKGSDWLLKSAEKIGLAFGMSSFAVGVIIVGAGTSLPELVSSLSGVRQGLYEIPAANAIGSNIANIFLIVGIATLLARRLTITKNLIDLELPLLAATTVLFLGVALDGNITLLESLLLLGAFVIYLCYSIFHKEDEELSQQELVPHIEAQEKPSLQKSDLFFLVIGAIALGFGAEFLIRSVKELSTLLGIGAGVIALLAVAVGTSLPELLVSAKAALQKKPDVALGNIFGSNVFNILLVIGIPGLFHTLVLDAQTLQVGLPALIGATLLLLVSGISRRIYLWEGGLYLLLYILFVGKVLALF